MKIAVIIVTLVVFSLLIAGIIGDITDQKEALVSKLYGIATLILFFVWMPLFLFSRSKKTQFKKYIISSETEEIPRN